MPIELPPLDDRTYADLVQEGVALIPRYAPGWTNHNASDPGITLVELFAYITDNNLYRLGRVSAPARQKFLGLLGPTDGANGLSDDERLNARIAELRRPSRAVTAADYELLAAEALQEAGCADAVARIQCFPRRDLAGRTAAERRRDRPNHVSVVFVPTDLFASSSEIESLAEVIRHHVSGKRLLTTRVHVGSPRFVDVTLRIRVGVAAKQHVAPVRGALERTVAGIFSAPDGASPLGRSLYVAELYRALSQVPGIQRVESLTVESPSRQHVVTTDDGDIVGIRVEQDELLRRRAVDIAIEG